MPIIRTRFAAYSVVFGAMLLGCYGAFADALITWTGVTSACTAEATGAVAPGVEILTILLAIAVGIKVFHKFVR